MDHIHHRHAHWTAVAMILNAAVAVGFVVSLLLPILAQPH